MRCYGILINDANLYQRNSMACVAISAIKRLGYMSYEIITIILIIVIIIIICGLRLPYKSTVLVGVLSKF